MAALYVICIAYKILQIWHNLYKSAYLALKSLILSYYSITYIHQLPAPIEHQQADMMAMRKVHRGTLQELQKGITKTAEIEKDSQKTEAVIRSVE